MKRVNSLWAILRWLADHVGREVWGRLLQLTGVPGSIKGASPVAVAILLRPLLTDKWLVHWQVVETKRKRSGQRYTAGRIYHRPLQVARYCYFLPPLETNPRSLAEVQLSCLHHCPQRPSSCHVSKLPLFSIPEGKKASLVSNMSAWRLRISRRRCWSWSA